MSTTSLRTTQLEGWLRRMRSGDAAASYWASRAAPKSIPAAQVEHLVLGQIQKMGRSPQLLHHMLAQVRQQDDACLAEVESERSGLVSAA